MSARVAKSIDRLPPSSLEAEQAALGCVIQDPNTCLAECASVFGNELGQAFYDLRHQLVINTMVSMQSRGLPVDMVTLCQELKDKGVLEQCGGIGYVSVLPDAAPSVANLSYYLRTLHEKFLLRKLMRVCTETIREIYEYEGDSTGLLERVERDILSIRAFSSAGSELGIKTLVKQALDDFNAASVDRKPVDGLATGWTDLDSITGGLHAAEMIIVAGFTSYGKTSLALNIAENVLLNHHLPVGIFSLEMTALELVKRCICSHARVNLRNVRQGFLSERDFPKITTSAGKYMNASMHFDDTSDLTVFEFRARARRMWQRHGIKLLVLDYLQLLSGGGPSRRAENRQQEVSEISRNVKVMAKEMHIPIIALSQLNDDGKLRESRAIGQDADCVWVIQKGAGANDDASAIPVELQIRKQRNGATGRIPLTFLKNFTRFESAAKVDDSEQEPQQRADFL